MGTIIALKDTCEDFAVEFEVQPIVEVDNIEDERQRRILEGTASIEEYLSEVRSKLDKLNMDIDRLTNHADGVDYAIAVTSGAITGMIDVMVVGEWNFAEAKKETYQEINNKVVEFAKKQPEYMPYCNLTLEGGGNPRRKPKDPDRLETAIEFLEWKFPLPGDDAYTKGHFGINGMTHRLDDLCHHPTIVGLICCIIVQFTGKTIYVNKYGKMQNIPITIDDKGEFVGNNAVTKLFAGVINWFITCAKTIANRKGHMMSDIATKASLPGSFLSTITELASLPCFKNEEFLTKLRVAYTKGIGTGKGQIDLGVFNKLFEGAQNKLDITTEKAVVHELKRQAMPIVINEVFVRAAYFIRRMIGELKEKQDVMAVEWKNIIPFNNRTIVRMMTIAAGTFTTIDMADAAVRSATRSVDVTTFFSNMLLRVNFVGVGRFAIAIGSDAGMGVSRSIKRNARIKLQGEQLLLLNAKVYYIQAGMWIAAGNTEEALKEVYGLMEKTTKEFVGNVVDIRDVMRNIGEMTYAIEKKNPGLIDELDDILK